MGDEQNPERKGGEINAQQCVLTGNLGEIPRRFTRQKEIRVHFSLAFRSGKQKTDGSK